MTHIIFCFVDHFEPKWLDADKQVQVKRVDEWFKRYPEIAQKHTDGDGKHPQHTWFYPAEEYEYDYLEKLSSLCKKGYGEIELHLHHRNDTSDGLISKINAALSNYRRHGAFETINEPCRVTYAFIHGNWALDNSHEKGLGCGVNNEITILRNTGCYADFTLPAAPSSCQTRKINSIYYATDDPRKPKSHNTGIDVQVGKRAQGDLMIIQGPLCLNWKNRKYGIFPHIENSEVSGMNPATAARIDLWVRQRIHVVGRGNWIFVKVHCHGTQERDWSALLGPAADAMYDYLEKNYNDAKKYTLHYVTARECYNIIKAAEAGEDGDPNNYRNYEIEKYRNSAG
jgi:hypothetical protein